MPAASTLIDLYTTADPGGANALAASAVVAAGGNQQHTNLMPFLCVNFIIALFGVFPSRS